MWRDVLAAGHPVGTIASVKRTAPSRCGAGSRRRASPCVMSDTPVQRASRMSNAGAQIPKEWWMFVPTGYLVCMNSYSHEPPTGMSISGPTPHGSCQIRVLDRDRLHAARARRPAPQDSALVASILGAISSRTRVQILFALGHAELCVCEIAELTGTSQSATSHALRKLRSAGVVVFRRDGKLAHYRVADVSVLELVRAASAILNSDRPERQTLRS